MSNLLPTIPNYKANSGTVNPRQLFRHYLVSTLLLNVSKIKPVKTPENLSRQTVIRLLITYKTFINNKSDLILLLKIEKDTFDF